MNLTGKLFRPVAAFCFLTTLSFSAFSQCNPDDPTIPLGPDDPGPGVPCPLDTWVFVLAAAAVVFVVWHMRKQQTQLSSL